MYILGFAVGPLILAPMSEYFGRNPVYMLSWFLLVIFQIPLALAPNIAAVIACRLLQGFFGSAPLTVSHSHPQRP
jgi:MFS family permease